MSRARSLSKRLGDKFAKVLSTKAGPKIHPEHLLEDPSHRSKIRETYLGHGETFSDGLRGACRMHGG
jgi:hypothetical protein